MPFRMAMSSVPTRVNTVDTSDATEDRAEDVASVELAASRLSRFVALPAVSRAMSVSTLVSTVPRAADVARVVIAASRLSRLPALAAVSLVVRS